MAELNEVKEEIKATKKVSDPWAKKVTIHLRKSGLRDDNFMLVAVNGRYFKVKKGEDVEVPQPIAEEIEASLKAQDKAEEFLEALVRR